MRIGLWVKMNDAVKIMGKQFQKPCLCAFGFRDATLGHFCKVCPKLPFPQFDIDKLHQKLWLQVKIRQAA